MYQLETFFQGQNLENFLPKAHLCLFFFIEGPAIQVVLRVKASNSAVLLIHEVFIFPNLPTGGGTWWQGIAASLPVFEIYTTIYHRLPYQ